MIIKHIKRRNRGAETVDSRGECDRGKQGRLLSGATADARDADTRRTGFRAVVIVLFAVAEKAGRPAGGEDRAEAWSGRAVPGCDEYFGGSADCWYARGRDEALGMGCRQLSRWRQPIPEGRLPE
jgi:hypothetical protein